MRRHARRCGVCGKPVPATATAATADRWATNSAADRATAGRSAADRAATYRSAADGSDRATAYRHATTGYGRHARPHLAARLADQYRVARLDHLVDDGQPFVERDERRLHRVDGEPLEVTPPIAESLDQSVHFAAHESVAHQPVVGVDGHPEASSGQQVERV